MPKTTIDAAGSPLIRLKGAVQQYPWGRTGSASLAARLAPNAVGPEFKLDEKESYAEVCVYMSLCDVFSLRPCKLS